MFPHPDLEARQELLDALGDVQDSECLVVSLTGNFWPAYGGGPIEGEDVVVILVRGLGQPVPPVLGTAPGPGDDFDPQQPTWPGSSKQVRKKSELRRSPSGTE